MNTVYLRYAVAVAKAGSLNKAAEELFIAQPNLSRAIKELEKELDVTIFDRTSKGIRLTEDGKKLVAYGKKIIKQIDDVEAEFRAKKGKRRLFSASVPRACYIAKAFADFSNGLSAFDRCAAVLKECDNRSVVDAVVERESKIGIIRYAENLDKQIKEMLESKKLSHELVAEFGLSVVASAKGVLGDKKSVTVDELKRLVEVAYNEPYALNAVSAVDETSEYESDKIIFVDDRGTKFDLLAANTDTYSWVSPVPSETLERYGLVRLKVDGVERKYRDVLIYPSDTALTDADKDFITALCQVKRKYVD